MPWGMVPQAGQRKGLGRKTSLGVPVPAGTQWPRAPQADFPLYDPPTYSADHKDMAVQDPFSP